MNAWSSVISMMVLVDGSELRPFQLQVDSLVWVALLLLFRRDPTPAITLGAGHPRTRAVDWQTINIALSRVSFRTT